MSTIFFFYSTSYYSVTGTKGLSIFSFVLCIDVLSLIGVAVSTEHVLVSLETVLSKLDFERRSEKPSAFKSYREIQRNLSE